MSTQNPSFGEYTATLARRVDAALWVRSEAGKGCPAKLHEAIRYSLLASGKRLRPNLVLMAAGACRGSPEAAMPAACAVEMVHTYSLIHDDLPAMDDADLRRGQPTCHKVFGEAMAILAGDALLAMAFEVLAKEIKPPEVAAACCATLAVAAGPCQLVGGQADDLAGSGPQGLGPGAGLPELEAIHHRKTGAMIGACLRLGGLVACAAEAPLHALDQYGRCLGLAFQITDDLLDVRGDSATAGKPVGRDAGQGKLTFPGLLGINESQRRAKQLVEDACLAVAVLGEPAGRLVELARFVLERNR